MYLFIIILLFILSACLFISPIILFRKKYKYINKLINRTDLTQKQKNNKIINKNVIIAVVSTILSIGVFVLNIFFAQPVAVRALETIELILFGLTFIIGISIQINIRKQDEKKYPEFQLNNRGYLTFKQVTVFVLAVNIINVIDLVSQLVAYIFKIPYEKAGPPITFT